MGQGASQEELDAVGYRVLGVQPNSPASSAGLVSFFDFVIAANGCPLKQLDQTFVEMIKDSENKALPLSIYNIKSETTRDVVITPRRNWGGQGMLGVTIRFDSYWRAEEALVRVLSVEPDSPGELAGLEAEKDYLLGTAEKVFKDTEALYEEVRKFLDSTVEFFVYNTITDEVRVVVVMPTENWNGQGCLGVSVGHGYLHRLPHRCKQSTGRSIEPKRSMILNLKDATATDASNGSANDGGAAEGGEEGAGEVKDGNGGAGGEDKTGGEEEGGVVDSPNVSIDTSSGGAVGSKTDGSADGGEKDEASAEGNS